MSANGTRIPLLIPLKTLPKLRLRTQPDTQRLPADHQAHVEVLLEGVAAEQRVQVAHPLVVAVHLHHTLTDA